jgi:tetratricopeptide (TPR) repeat protein
VPAPRKVASTEPPPVLSRVEKPAAEATRPPAPKPRDDAAPEFAEAEFFIEQGLFDEAKEALAALRRRAASRPDLAARVEALAQRIAQPKPPVDKGLVDLGTELAAEVSAVEAGAGAAEEFQYSVQDVLQQFKKGVEKAVRSEDVETHYELGIAYKEMGLTDEAIGEFEVALRGAAGKPKEPDCLAMVGLCLSAKGEFTKAVGYFERALAAKAIRPESALNLHYEIGAAKEASGELGGALEAYERVAKTDPAYRNVGVALSRVRAARASQNGSPLSRRGERAGESEGTSRPSGEAESGKARKVGYL